MKYYFVAVKFFYFLFYVVLKIRIGFIHNDSNGLRNTHIKLITRIRVITDTYWTKSVYILLEDAVLCTRIAVRENECT